MFWVRVAAARLIGILMLSSITTESSSPEYHYYNQTLTWPDAQRFCRVKHSDLATVTSMEEAGLLAQTANRSDAWIGLRLAGRPKWLWSDGSGAPVATFWLESEPNALGGKEACVKTADGGWNDVTCTVPQSFGCQSGTTYLHRAISLSWTDAQDHCRSQGMDLPTVTSWSENEISLNAAGDTSAWIGLFLDQWLWSGGSPSSFRHWLAGRPTHVHGCAVVRVRDEGRWDEEECEAKMPFVCQGGLKSQKRVMKLTMDSDGDLDRSAASVQLLQQLELQLRSQGVSDFRLSWRSDIHRQAEMDQNSAAESQGPEC